jgi:hypothetical protein
MLMSDYEVTLVNDNSECSGHVLYLSCILTSCYDSVRFCSRKIFHPLR